MQLAFLALLQHCTLAPLEGSPVRAEQLSATRQPDGVVVRAVVEGEPRSWRLEDLLEIRMEASAAPPPALPGVLRVITVAGDRLHGRAAQAEREALRLDLTTAGSAEIPLERISAIIVVANEPALPRTAGPNRAAARDRIYLRHGDIDEGSLLAVGSQEARWYSENFQAERSAPWDDLAGLFLVPLVQPAAAEGPLVRAEFRDGSALTGTLEALEDVHVRLRDRFGTTWTCAREELYTLLVVGGRVVYLSDMTPTLVDENANYIRLETPSAGDLEIPWRPDRSARDTPLRLRGTEYRKGMGVHARSRLVFDVSEAYERFESIVGVDDVATPYGAVRFLVRVDNQIRLDTGEITARDEPRPISVDLRGARSLELICEFGSNGGAGAYGDWAAARLIRLAQP